MTRFRYFSAPTMAELREQLDEIPKTTPVVSFQVQRDGDQFCAIVHVGALIAEVVNYTDSYGKPKPLQVVGKVGIIPTHGNF